MLTKAETQNYENEKYKNETNEESKLSEGWVISCERTKETYKYIEGIYIMISLVYI